jgi:hypothetical protein
MVGHGIASSLVHEVGHQVAALLELVPTLRAALRGGSAKGPDRALWDLWRSWTSEAIADVWSVGHVGVASTLGLIAVVSLPRPFVFRINVDGPHPTPWIRVHLSCAVGRQLYPDPMWDALLGTWRELYPPTGLGAEHRRMLDGLAATAPECASLLLAHAPRTLGGRSVAALLPRAERRPERLRRRFDEHRTDLRGLRPTEAMAVLGLARMDGRLPAVDEGQHVDRLLVSWALRRALVNEPPARRNADDRSAPPAVRRDLPLPSPATPALVGALTGARR